MFQWREYATVAVAGYILNVFTTVGLIVWLGILGAVLSLLVAQATNLAISLLVLRASVIIPENLKFWRYRPNKELILRVGRFIGPLTTVAILPTIALVYIRSEIFRQLGADANGIFQVVWGISVTYMGLIVIALGSYGVPKVTSLLSDPEEIRKIQNHGLRLGVFVVTPVIIGLSALRDIWIPILYSSSFLAAAGILVWQFGADFTRVVRQSLNINLVPHERFGYIYWNAFLLWGGWMILSKLLIPHYGLPAVPISYFAVNFASAIIGFGYQRMKMGFQLSSRNRTLLIKALLLGSVGVIATHFAVVQIIRLLIAAITLAIMAAWMPTKKEYADLLAYAKESISTRDPGEPDELP
jgi:PST family polysaccharide transporter